MTSRTLILKVHRRSLTMAPHWKRVPSVKVRHLLSLSWVMGSLGMFDSGFLLCELIEVTEEYLRRVKGIETRQPETTLSLQGLPEYVKNTLIIK